jgi:glucosamine kinase
MIQPLFLGVDGGGSRCRARLETAEGRVVGCGASGPASMRLGFEVVRDAIMAATRQSLAEAGLPESALSRTFAGIGVAGTGIIGARETLEAWRHPFAGAWFEGDAYIAFLGAFGGIEGGIVVAGTGSIGIAYLDKTVRVGGYGFPVSDEGSGAHIGVNALRHALRTLDGRAEASAFSQEVLARFSDDAAEVTDWMKNARPTDYASLAPLVVKHASAGDQPARRIMQAAGTQIADLVEGLFKRGAPRVALVGGLATALKDYMPPEVAARLVAPEADPIAGAILLAKKKQGALIAMGEAQ